MYIEKIQEYYKAVSAHQDAKETFKRERFLKLLTELFPEEAESLEKYVAGGESSVHIVGRPGTGSIDTLYGNLVIEFERNLEKQEKFNEGYYQLKEYTSGLWNEEEKRRSYICVLSDGINWHCYYPHIDIDKVDQENNQLRPDYIQLTEKETFVLKSGDKSEAEEFFHFLDRYFFRTMRLKPSVEVFTRDFGTESVLWERAKRELESILDDVGEDSEVSTAYSQWLRYLTYTYGSPAAERTLFIRHTYLTMLARMLTAIILFSGEMRTSDTKTIHSINRGDFFEYRNIENLADKDFFYWIERPEAAKQLEGLWLSILSQLKTYEFDALEEDILKGVYQELVDPQDRHDLGEYYTPDWLCVKTVERSYELWGKNMMPSVLDPTCGSGSFLRAAIEKILEKETSTEQADIVVRDITTRVVGLDVHPLAVTVAKANYVIALRSLLPHVTRPVRIPVYLSDSLFMPEAELAEETDEEHQKELFKAYQEYGYVNFQGSRHRFPVDVFLSAPLYDRMISLSAEAAENIASGREESVNGLIGTLQREKTGMQRDEVAEAAQAVFGLANEMAERIRRRQDSIWSFVLRNSYRPALFRSTFDIVVGNPPWLSYRYISDPQYQGQIKHLAVEKYGLAPRKQSLMTHMELASLFLVHVTHTYLKKDGVLGFVMPRSIFNADQHDKFRSETYQARCDMVEYWDLEKVKPLFNVPSCVAFAKNAVARANKRYRARFFSGNLTARDVPWSIAKKEVSEETGFINLVHLGKRSALSRNRIKPLASGEKPYYSGLFYQGATIVPRNFYFIVPDNESTMNRALVPIKTDPEQQKDAKPPWKPLVIEGRVERELIFTTALSKHLLPFMLLPDLPRVVLPLVEKTSEKPTVPGNSQAKAPEYELCDSSRLRELGFREGAEWFARAEELWIEHRAAKSTYTLEQWLNYNNKLMRQNPAARWLVVFNAVGTNLSSALIDQKDHLHRFWADHRQYILNATTQREGFYLVGILNSKAINKAIKPFQSKGQQGERDIHKLPLELPIPRFDPENRVHTEIAGLSEQASQKVEASYQRGEIEGRLAAMRGSARQIVDQELKKIDKLVAALLSGDA